MLTIPQKRVAELIRECASLRRDQIEWYLYRAFQWNPRQSDIALRQLHMLGKIRIEGDMITHPQKQIDIAMLDAFDIMILLCKGVPELSCNNGLCKLLFFSQEDGEKLKSFKIILVPIGKEEIISAKLEADIFPKGHTLLFLLNSITQAEQLYSSRPCYFLAKQSEKQFEIYESNSIQNTK